MTTFIRKLEAAWQANNSLLCVGLDPDMKRFPAHLAGRPRAIAEFCRAIVDATADVVCAFKPQIAYFASQGAERELEDLCHYIRETYPDVLLVLDAKRGDIGPTAEHYAREAFDRYGAHVVTVNPYLGTDSVAPFLTHEGGGVFVLCRTSNPGGSDVQFLQVEGKPIYQLVAEQAAALAGRILKGERAESIPPIAVSAATLTFDARELELPRFELELELPTLVRRLACRTVQLCGEGGELRCHHLARIRGGRRRRMRRRGPHHPRKRGRRGRRHGQRRRRCGGARTCRRAALERGASPH
jgi:orotidine 5'-phosphate decarboxylase subfamily 2